MAQTVKELIDHIELGLMESHERVSILPLFSTRVPELVYMTLEEAIEDGLVNISEMNNEGVVPELELVNSSGVNVLLIDGEELQGAKQNRVLNGSIIAMANARMTVPVSCTERGRWSQGGGRFRSSGSVMPRDLRASKSRWVDESRRNNYDWSVHQSKVWDGVDDLIERTGSNSPTRAMKSAIDSSLEDVNRWVGLFSPKPNQVGMVVFTDGALSGVEMCSRPEAFTKLMPKLLGSYAFECVLRNEASPSTEPESSERVGTEFFESLSSCEIEEYRTPGIGIGLKFENTRLYGTALRYGTEMVQMSAYSID